MTENMKRFLEEAEKDAAFAEKLEAAESPEALLALAAEKGFTLTAEDLAAEETAGELSDDELDDVAGGAAVQKLYVRLKLRFPLWQQGSGGFVSGLHKTGSPEAENVPFFGGSTAASGITYFGGIAGPKRLGDLGGDGGTVLKEV